MRPRAETARVTPAQSRAAGASMAPAVAAAGSRPAPRRPAGRRPNRTGAAAPQAQAAAAEHGAGQGRQAISPDQPCFRVRGRRDGRRLQPVQASGMPVGGLVVHGGGGEVAGLQHLGAGLGQAPLRRGRSRAGRAGPAGPRRARSARPAKVRASPGSSDRSAAASSRWGHHRPERSGRAAGKTLRRRRRTPAPPVRRRSLGTGWKGAWRALQKAIGRLMPSKTGATAAPLRRSRCPPWCCAPRGCRPVDGARPLDAQICVRRPPGLLCRGGCFCRVGLAENLRREDRARFAGMCWLGLDGCGLPGFA